MAILDGLNKEQEQAVRTTEGPLLVLAGAGSGKTRVLTRRIAYLIKEKGVAPWNILAITFTNKAAGEMRERVDSLAGAYADSIWVSTFHSACVRILRRYIDRLGYGCDFSIYDSDDSRTLMKQIIKRAELDPKVFREKTVLAAVSSAKNELIGPEKYLENAAGDIYKQKLGRLYMEYQKALKKNNALDFDDLIGVTVELFRKDSEVLLACQEKFRYIHIDEYQDTNAAQFALINLLAGKYKNLCAVGDDDQSIYGFRGADIRNILDFEKAFPGAAVIRLEQNYRSTKSILDAANDVIKNNKNRKGKNLWSDLGTGEPPKLMKLPTDYQEASAVAEDILKDKYMSGRAYEDYAVLYRTNAQSRLLEEKFIEKNIPYRLVGGVNFYQRKEIKDILSYLKVLGNGNDDLAAQRIINVPKRGIGAASMARIMDHAMSNGISFLDACYDAEKTSGLGRSLSKIRAFTGILDELRAGEDAANPVTGLIKAVMTKTGYKDELLDDEPVAAQSRLENIDELLNKAAVYEKTSEKPSLAGFLEEVALVADTSEDEDDADRVTLMTLHGAKGLEFDCVYLTGMEEGLFPGAKAAFDPVGAELEEERRLCYVGITRAKKRLVLTQSLSRMMHGEICRMNPSRFLSEIENLYGKTPDERGFEKTGQDRTGVDSLDKPKQILRSQTAFHPQMSSHPQPTFGRSFSVSKPSSLDYVVGDRVRHIKFGDGTVLGIVDSKRDFEVEVDFDRAGVRKMFASFAKLKKI